MVGTTTNELLGDEVIGQLKEGQDDTDENATNVVKDNDDKPEEIKDDKGPVQQDTVSPNDLT